MLNPRLAELNDYPFQRLRDLLDGHAPGGPGPAIALSLGEPQHPYPDLVGEVLHDNRFLYGKYPPVNGTPELRRAIADWLGRRYGLDAGRIDPDANVMPLSGTREGLFMLAQIAVPRRKSGGRPIVQLPSPYYACYLGAARMADAEPLLLAATGETGNMPDFDLVAADTWARTALVYLCSPANPQGNFAPLDLLERLIERAREFDFVLAVDECYAEIYARTPPPGALQAAARLGGGLDNLLVFHSLSKRSSVPGLRSGFVAGDARLIAEYHKLRGFGGAPSPLPVSAAATALWNDEAHVEANRALYRAKFDLGAEILGDRFGFTRPEGGFFLWLDVDDGERAALKLWREAGVRVLPGGYLARPDGHGRNPGAAYIRLALVQDEATTAEALTRVAATL